MKLTLLNAATEKFGLKVYGVLSVLKMALLETARISLYMFQNAECLKVKRWLFTCAIHVINDTVLYPFNQLKT
mgnify:CR=1 FL=1